MAQSKIFTSNKEADVNNNDPREKLFHRLREDYYDVTLYRWNDPEDEELDYFTIYGTPESIIGLMDSLLMTSGYENDDWSHMCAAISYNDFWTIAYMPSLDCPEYEFVSDIVAFEELATGEKD